MADIVGITLRFLHIVFGVRWIGAVFYGVGVLRVVLPRVDMAERKAVLRHLLPVAVRYIPISAIMTIVTGTLLYLYLGQFQGLLLLWYGLGPDFARRPPPNACDVCVRAGHRGGRGEGDFAALGGRSVHPPGGGRRPSATVNVGQFVVLALGLVIIATMVYVSEAI